MLDKSLNIVVLMGGWSSEREVSLMSGKGIVAALEERGFTNVTPVDMDRNVAQVLAGIRPDVVFNALHGTPGEDGTIQGLLDLMQIPYTHSGLETSVIAIDKELTKMVLVPHGIRMPKGKVVTSKSLYEGDLVWKRLVSLGFYLRPWQTIRYEESVAIGRLSERSRLRM